MTIPAPDSPEAQAALVHIDAAKMRGSAVALLDAIGPVVAKVAAQVLDKALERDQDQGEAA